MYLTPPLSTRVRTQVVSKEDNEALSRQVKRLAGERDAVRDELDVARAQLHQLASAEAVAKQEAEAAQSQLVTNEDSAHEHAAKLVGLQRALVEVRCRGLPTTLPVPDRCCCGCGGGRVCDCDR